MVGSWLGVLTPFRCPSRNGVNPNPLVVTPGRGADRCWDCDGAEVIIILAVGNLIWGVVGMLRDNSPVVGVPTPLVTVPTPFPRSCQHPRS